MINYEKNSLLNNLKEKGLSALNDIDAIQFAEKSDTMKNIADDVEKYFNYLTTEKVTRSNNPDYAKIEHEIDDFMDEYKKIVAFKRKQIEMENSKASFISKMANKIGDVKKYHHKSTTHQESHSHNPFVDDVRNV